MFNYAVGAKLRNGAVILAYRAVDNKRVVAARWNDERTQCPFITWRVDDDGNAFWGHYFDTKNQAMVDFNER
jgi:hypothetical protein